MTGEKTVLPPDNAADRRSWRSGLSLFDQLLAVGGNERAAAVLRRLGPQASDAGLAGYETVTTD